MKDILINTLAFAAGAAIGSAVTWKLVKTKYERIAQEEIESVKEVFSKKEETYEVEMEKDIPIEEAIADKAKEILNECADIIGTNNYVPYADIKKIKEEGGPDVVSYDDKPYVIEPEEFGELDDYERISLTYYADKVLTDEYDNPVEDVDNVVGLESLTTFGKYEDDSVFVRNDSLKSDYEILLDVRNFKDLNRDE